MTRPSRDMVAIKKEKHSKIGKRSSSKGGGFEIEICRQLTKWITGSRKPEIFWRSKGLGPKATRDRITGVKRFGDVAPQLGCREGEWLTDKVFIETKFHKDTVWSFDDLMRDQGKLLLWWLKLIRQAGSAGKLPLMVFKKNRYPICAMYDGRLAGLLGQFGDISPNMEYWNVRIGWAKVILWNEFLEIDHLNLKEVL